MYEFAAPTLKGVLRHIAAVHSWESCFYTVCGIQGCSRTYSNFFSFKKHIYRKHRELLDTAVIPSYSSEMDYLDALEDNCEPPDVVNEADPAMQLLESKSNSALFILKSKVMYKIPQVHLECLIADITELVERRLDSVREELQQVVERHQLSREVHISIMEVATAKGLSQPFSGLETNYLQLKYFEEYFGVIVSNYCICQI